MKALKLLVLSGIAMLLCTLIYAQVPQKFNYQAVARNNNAIIANGQVGVQLTITDSLGTLAYYQETQTATTNAYGIFSLEVGGGNPVIGTFSAIDWKTGGKWLNIQIDPAGGTAYTDMGSSKLLSVPFALQASKSLDSWLVNGNYIYNPNGNNVGINTNSPDKSLSVAGGMDVDKLGLSDGSEGSGNVALQNGLTFSGGSGEGLASNRLSSNPNQYGIDIYTNFTKQLSVTNGGNVGIGTSSPSTKLDVQGGDINTNGNINTGNKITATPTGTANMIPVAYGKVQWDGSIMNATPNVQTPTHVGPGVYQIGISGITFDGSYTCVVTPAAPLCFASAFPDPNGFQLDINTFQMFLVLAPPVPWDFAFSFVVYHN